MTREVTLRVAEEVVVSGPSRDSTDTRTDRAMGSGSVMALPS